MGLVKMMENASKDDEIHKYNFTIVARADEITAAIVSGEYDMATIPANLASVLYNKSNGGIVVAGINTLGVFILLKQGKKFII